MNSNKRRDASPAFNDVPKRPRKVCTYGENCYRRNPAHLREFSHPHLESILDNYTGNGEFPIPDSLLLQKSMIEEQLQIILDKNIHTPKTDKATAGLQITDKNIEIKPEKTERKVENTAGKTGSVVEKKEQIVPVSLNDGLSSSKIDNKKEMGNKQSTSKETNDCVKDEATSKNLVYSDYRPIVPPSRDIKDHFKVVLPKGRMAEKHKKASPYYIFYTTIADCKETHMQENSVTFQDILDSSLGELKCSLQINFMIDIGWLLAQYYFAGYSRKRLTILYGDDNPDLVSIGQKQKHVDAHYVNMGTPFGKHHTKLMLLCYEDGSLRVVVSTANLYIDDWENRTQGLWMSPACPELPEGSMPHDGDSPTGFKKSLLDYLDHYRMSYLTQYIERVRKCDFSSINVFLIASAPGGHTDARWGMMRMSSVLSQHCVRSDEPSTIIAQASSIGSYGNNPSLWLTGDFLNNFSRTKNESAFVTSQPKLKVIFPSLENVQQSHDGMLGGGCLPYSATVNSKQLWLKDFLYQWKAVKTHRNKAMPHIKTYMRVTDDYKKAAYFLLTSANISKAAWGTINKGNKALRIMSYEAGVLFIPKFVINSDHFPLDEKEKLRLPVIYDIPPTRYTSSMSPFVQEYLMG